MMMSRALILVTVGCSMVLAGCGTLAPSASAPLGPQSGVSKAYATPPPQCGKYGACSVVSCFGAFCFAFATDGSVQATLRSGISYAQGVATDRSGNSYIADSGSSKIFEYSPYFKTLLNTYDDTGEVPLDVAVDARHQLLVVSNSSTTSQSAGSVGVYAGGSTTPTATLSDPDAPDANGIGVAIDRNDNCFWSLSEPSSGKYKIDEFSSCAGTPATIVSSKRPVRGMAFDKADNLFFIVDVDTKHHDIFRCAGTIHCGRLATHFFHPVMLNFDDKWRFLWVDDAGVLEGPLVESVDPHNGRVVTSFRAGSYSYPPFGIAHAPGPR
jgi:hypothetical protein